MRKGCMKCHRRLELNDKNFDKNPMSKTGFYGTCKLCRMGLTEVVKTAIHKRTKTEKRKIEIKFVPSMANDMVINAVQKGIIPSARNLKCSVCGQQANLYHHHSYEEQYALDVVPMCYKCHNFIHFSPKSPYPFDVYTPEFLKLNSNGLPTRLLLSPTDIKDL